MSSLNRVDLIGNVGKDPESKTTGDSLFCRFSIATSESWIDKSTGEKKQKTEWHNIVCYRKLAEISSKYVKKGSKIYLSGSLSTTKYTGKDGVERYSTVITANKIEFLDSKQSSEVGNKSNGQKDFPLANYPIKNEQIQDKAPAYDDDIPF